MSDQNTKEEMVEMGMKIAVPATLPEENATSASSEDADEVAFTAEKPRPRLNLKNILNVVAFIINAVFTYGVGTSGWFGGKSNGELSDKYQTIITPKSTAFSIWAVIFLSEAIFTAVQLLPRYRGTAMVQQGVSYWFAAAGILQSLGWTFAFAFEAVPLSLFFMFTIWISLMSLLYSQYYIESDGSLLEFWLLRFPFAIHGGWITAASALNVNVVSVWKNDPATTQLALAIISLAVLHAVSVWVLFNMKRPNYTIACVLCWANFWIYSELQDATELVVSTFGDTIITSVAYAARAVCFIILAQVILRVILCGYQIYRRRLTSNDIGKE